MTKAAALETLNSFLSDTIDPAELKQVEGLSKGEFTAWMSRADLPRSTKNNILRELRPVLQRAQFEAVSLSGVRLQSTNRTASMVLVGVPLDLQQRLNTDLYVIFGDSHESGGGNTNSGGGNSNTGGGGGGNGNGNGNSNTMMDKCQYMKCFCANPSNCSCVTATRFQKNCPSNQCSKDSDCGTGGGSDSGIIDAISAF